jgi:hypothetical protein
MGISRSIAAVVVVIAIVAIAKNVTITVPKGAPQAVQTAGTAAAQPDALVDTVPPMPNNPHAFTIVPKNYNDPPPQLVAAARSMIARWKAWKAKPTAEVIPYGDCVPKTLSELMT